MFKKKWMMAMMILSLTALMAAFFSDHYGVANAEECGIECTPNCPQNCL